MLKRVLLLLIVLISGCNQDKKRLVEAEKLNFKTTDASELFFKNVRQINYQKEVMKESKLDLFVPEFNEGLPLRFSIAINWRFDQAYLQVERTKELETMESVSFNAVNDKNNTQETFTFESGNLTTQLNFATWIYNQVLQGNKIIYGEGQKPLFTADGSKEAFRKFMVDYYRLIEAY